MIFQENNKCWLNETLQCLNFTYQYGLLTWGASHIISKAWMFPDVKPPRLVLGKITTNRLPWRWFREDATHPCISLRVLLYRCKHAGNGVRHLWTRICSCFITLLISVLIFVSFCFQSIQLEVQLVHTLVFGKGIHEPAPKAPPCHFPCDTMHKSGLSPRQQGERRGTKVKTLPAGQITEAEKQVPGYYVPASVAAAKLPLGHMCMFN